MNHPSPAAFRRALVLVAALAACTPAEPPAATLLITGARIADGSGAPAFEGAVRVTGDRIAAVGDLTALPGERVVDATGLLLAPGFIDTHSHHDRGLLETRDAFGAVSQGITTIVVGQDGGSQLPVTELWTGLEATPVSVNVASYAGHNALRREVMGDDFRRPATPAEVDRMAALLATEMDAGALGLSTGLEYDPGLYSERDEVIALARVAAAHGGRYISHMRSEDRYFWDALDELIEVGRATGMPVQVSHMKLAMKGLWGEASRAIEVMEAARAEGVDVTADVYPYTYWQSTMTVIFPDRDFEDRSAFEFALDQVVPPEGLRLTRYEPEPEYVGRTLAEIAAERGEDPVDTYMMLVRESQALAAATGSGTESVLGTSMDPADVRALLGWPHTNVSSDGSLRGGHPRGYGAFPRFLGRIVREDGLLSLEEAVRRMTSLAADHMGIEDRGRIEPGAFADIVLFDPEGVIDRATPEDPQRAAEGIARVWVNGLEVYAGGSTTDARPGRVLRRTPR